MSKGGIAGAAGGLASALSGGSAALKGLQGAGAAALLSGPLGGVLQVDSPLGRGTRVRAELPCG